MSADATPLRAAVPPVSKPALAPASRQGVAASVEMSGTSLVFLAFLAVLLIEYIGLAQEIALLKTVRASTLLAWGAFAVVLLKVGPAAFVEYRQNKLLLAFVLFSGATIGWAIVKSYVGPNFRYHSDYLALFVATLYLVDRPARLKQLALVLTAIILVLVVRNLDMLGNEFRMGQFRAGYFAADGNDFGWALVTLLAFPLFLLLGKNGLILRAFGLAGAGAAVLGVVGTGSRGATLALAAAVLYYWLVSSKHKVLGLAVLAVLVFGVITFAPASYMQRMQTIQDYEEDSSAQARIRAWKAAFAMAIDYPLGVGAGNFNSAYGRFYMPEEEGWGMRRWISAHSVYFKILGEYGFIGLSLLLALLAVNLYDNQVLLRRLRTEGVGAALPEQWPALLNLAIVAYAVAAIFLGGVAYPHLFLLSGLTLSCRRIAETSTQAHAGSREPERAPKAQWRPPTQRAGATVPDNRTPARFPRGGTPPIAGPAREASR
jgi:putative inorganic carbon (hco3(-)) transporter